MSALKPWDGQGATWCCHWLAKFIWPDFTVNATL